MAGYTDIKTVSGNGKNYVQTNEPYTQPAIFNVVDLTKADGIVYAIVSLAVLLMTTMDYYQYVFLADIMWIAMFLFIKHGMIKLVRYNKIKWCNYGSDGNIFFCRRAMAIMRSAFIRLPICLFLIIRGQGLKGSVNFFMVDNMKENLIALGIGAFVCFVGIVSLLFPRNCHVETNHQRYYRLFDEARLAKYRVDNPVIDSGIPAAVPYSGAGKNLTGPGEMSSFSSKKATASGVDTVHVDSTQDTGSEEQDVFKNKRVNRKRREF